MRILVCAATRTEHDACAGGIADARVGRATFEMLLTGVGPARARRALAARLAARLAAGKSGTSRGGTGSPELVVSTGFAGAMDRSLARLSWVTASRVRDVVGVALREGPPSAQRCEIVSSRELVDLGTVSTGSGTLVAVDMESAALAEVAAQHGVPFMVLRLISDTPDSPLPPFLTGFAGALAADDMRSKLRLASRGVRAALADPRGVARVVQRGREWTAALHSGWARFAQDIPTLPAT